MTVKIGDRLPAVTLRHLGADGFQDLSTEELFKGRKVVLFAVPGAFTPACSDSHLPGYVANAAAFKAKGVDALICVAVNDPFVMKAWGRHVGVDDRVEMLPDGNGDFTRALGLELDARGFNLGRRSQRYAMLVDDGVIKALEIETAPGEVSVSGAEAMLAKV